MPTEEILLVPGLGNSNEDHWQTYWEKAYHFKRVTQQNWDTPSCKNWVEALDKAVRKLQTPNVILVGHSLACATIAKWASTFYTKIKGALLVAPADTEAPGFPPVTTGFAPMSLDKLPFPSMIVASTNDEYVTIERATFFAKAWGSQFVNIGAAGHINATAGFTQWQEGLQLLKKLRDL
jgi:predicted alpha/beta hydrolase family esterase